MDFEYLKPRCAATECGDSIPSTDSDGCLSVVVIFDHPSSDTALDEALFSLAAQDHESLDIIVVTPDAGRYRHDQVAHVVSAQPWPANDAGARHFSLLRMPKNRFPVISSMPGLTVRTGRYVTLINHQDLIYQHGYRVLINRLENSAIAFGGITISTHIYDFTALDGRWQNAAASRTNNRVRRGRSRFGPSIRG